MARKTKDLFQLLEKRRSKGSFKVKPDPEPNEPVDVVGAVGDWFRRVLGSNSRPKRRPARKKLAARPVGILISGPALAGMAFASLVVGFLLGQALTSGGSAALAAEKTPITPDWLPGAEPGPGELDPHLQIQLLGDYAYLLGQYPIGADPDAPRAAAERLATYLRARGLERTRIFKFWGPGGVNVWLTLYYTQGPAPEPAVLAKLEAVAAPPFEAGWAQVLAGLAERPEPVSLTPPDK